MDTAPLPPPFLARQPDPEHDPLAPVDRVAKVWNRLAVAQLASRMLDAAHSQGLPAGILVIAVDPSNAIKELYGLMPDVVFSEVCGRIRKALGATDVVGRIAREELLVVLPGRSQEVIAATAGRILRSVTGEPVRVSGLALPVSLAIGATIAERGDGPLDELVKTATAALTRAKQSGESRVEMRWPTASARLSSTAS